MAAREPNDPLPMARDEILEEISYWTEQRGAGLEGSRREAQVAQRLKSLYAVLQSLPPPKPAQSRAVLTFRGLIRGIPYFGPGIDAFIFGEE